MRAFAAEKYLETKSFNASIRDFVTKFNPKPPYKFLIVKWVAKFRTEWTVRNLRNAENLFSSTSVTWSDKIGSDGFFVPKLANVRLFWNEPFLDQGVGLGLFLLFTMILTHHELTDG